MTDTNKPEPYVTEQEVARRFALSLSHVKNWRKNGKGPTHVRIGHVVVYSEASIAKFVAAHTRK